MPKKMLVNITEQLPQLALSKAWGWLARRRRPKLGVGIAKHAFVLAAGIDMTEAKDDIADFDTLEDLFVRELRPERRRVEPDPTAFISPVDAEIGAFGAVESGTLMQVKGRSYGIGQLLGDQEMGQRFEGGSYVTLYLSPSDYHRVHAPVAGAITEARLCPGGLRPVYVEALDMIDGVFAQNERLITYIDTAHAGRVAVVKVGAMLVGRISVTYDRTFITNTKRVTPLHRRYDPPFLVTKGAEIGAFQLGSTVVLISEAGKIDLDGIVAGAPIRFGQRIGTITARHEPRG